MAYTEFFCTKGASASDLNGGGPRLGTNDAPIYTTANATVAGGALTTVVDNTANNWAGVLVDDFLCWDTGGVKEIRRVSALAPGGDATKITIASAATAGANKTCNVGGAFATVDFAASTITSGTTNAAGNYPRCNIKVGTYNEQVTIDNSGFYLIVYEGYETTPGDNCPSGTLPLLSSSSTAVAAGIYGANKNYQWIKNLRIVMSGAAIDGIRGNFNYSLFENIQIVATGNGYYNVGYSSCFNMTVESCGGEGFWTDSHFMWHCVSLGSGSWGFRSGSSGTMTCIGCISANSQYSNFLIGGQVNSMLGCIGYGSVTGSGAQVNYGSWGAFVKNCIFVGNATLGLDFNYAGMSGVEDFNAYYGNGTNETNNALPNYTNAVHPGPHSVTLTGDPFVNAAGGNFALNATAGAGAACRNAGFPGTLRDGVNVGYSDIGALRHQDAGGSSVYIPLGGFIVR